MRIVRQTEELEALIREIRNAPYVALDTEFMRDQTYWPKLCLVQVASPGTEAIIDPLADGIDLSSLYALLKVPDLLKVLHAGRQDIEIFFHRSGTIPDPLFDTQVAAMVCGFGDAASYETLARRLANAETDKSARFTDWSRRPLSPRQLDYALADVTHLRTIYEALAAQLERTGRTQWVAEEIAALKDPNLYRLDPKDAWRRMKVRTSNRRFLGVIAALAAWREREAQSLDIPRNRVLRDEALFEVAAHPPAQPADLERIRALPKGFSASRLGRSLMEAVAQGASMPLPEPAAPERRPRREPSTATVDLLKTLLRLRADQAGVAHRLIADGDDIARLAARDDEGVPALHGWRAEVFGKDALALRKGELALTLEDGEAVVVELDEND
jgi:ribonuclease D